MIKIQSLLKSSAVAALVSASLFTVASTNEAPVKTADNYSLNDLSPKSVHHQASRYISWFINDYHYKKPKLGDKESAEIFDRYIEMLDPNKSYFLAKDIQSFEKYRFKLDDSISYGMLTPSFEIYGVFQQRWKERNEFAMKLLEKEFDFNKQESFEIDREDAAWSMNTSELDNYWRKRVKNDALNLVLAEKTWDETKDILKNVMLLL